MQLNYLIISVILFNGNFGVISQNYENEEIRRSSKRITNDNFLRNQYSNQESLNVVVDDDNLNEITPISNTNENEAISLIETIPGEPQHDYPTFKTIPRTSFSCKGRVNWGYYADTETACQVFHICESEYSKISFLCPIGSAFNQKHLVCDWWYNFDCDDTISLTSLYDDYFDRTSGLGGNESSLDGDGDDHNRLARRLEKATKTKRRGNGYRNDDDDDDDVEDNDNENGLYDLNPASTGGNT